MDAGFYILFVNNAGSASWEMEETRLITVVTAWAQVGQEHRLEN